MYEGCMRGVKCMRGVWGVYEGCMEMYGVVHVNIMNTVCKVLHNVCNILSYVSSSV